MRYQSVLFDMDGTVLDTLEDMYESVNHTLRAFGYPERTRGEVRAFVGNGAYMLIRRALPKGGSEEQVQQAVLCRALSGQDEAVRRHFGAVFHARHARYPCCDRVEQAGFCSKGTG